MFHALAVNALNALVGSVGVPGGIMFTPAFPANQTGNAAAAAKSPAPAMDKFAADILGAQASPVHVLLLNDANPVFATPAAWRVKEAISKIPYIVSFGPFLDETSILADLILPDHSFLESWVDHVPESGTAMALASVAPPVMHPLHQTRAMPDVLLEVGRNLAKPLSPALPWQTYEEMLQAAFTSLPAAKAKAGQDSAPDIWTTAQQQGGWWVEQPAAAPAAAAPTAAAAGVQNARAVTFAAAQFDGAPNDYPFYFLPYASQAFLDGSIAHLPWLQELPDVLSTAMWSSWVEINPQTAAKLGIAVGDMVEVKSTQGTLRSPAVVSPGIAPDVIAMPVGQGHQTFTRYASGIGANPISILAAVRESETGALAWAATRVRISKVDSNGGLILFAGGMREPEHEHR
jgi:anaerobic selenocysteine-containing dehydrogenase